MPCGVYREEEVLAAVTAVEGLVLVPVLVILLLLLCSIRTRQTHTRGKGEMSRVGSWRHALLPRIVVVGVVVVW